MKIRKLQDPRGFTLVRNAAIEDETISYRARGVLVYLLSRPDGWETDSTRLAAKAKEGREAVRTALNELEAARYLKRIKRQAEQGRWITETLVSDHPIEGDLTLAPTLPGDWD